MHPADLFFGSAVPQVQSYLAAAASPPPDLEAARAQLGELLQRRFPRLCYRLPRRLGTISELRLAEDPTEPVEQVEPAAFDALESGDLARAVGDRHWRLYLLCEAGLVCLVLVFDHHLCHGSTARAFLYQALDTLGGQAGALDELQRERFLQRGRQLTQRNHAEAPWAEHRELVFPLVAARRLARALALPFTQGVGLWLGRSILDVSPWDREMEIQIFHMDPAHGADERHPLAVGNKGLQLQSLELLPSGRFGPVGPSQREREQQAEGFVRLYERYPVKTLLSWGMQAAVVASKRASRKQDREKLVVNNLGPSQRPFHRGMFFDPFNDVEKFGLVFVDGVGDELRLQLSPPRRYLQRFDLPAFERQLELNLERMPRDPRVKPLTPGLEGSSSGG